MLRSSWSDWSIVLCLILRMGDDRGKYICSSKTDEQKPLLCSSVFVVEILCRRTMVLCWKSYGLLLSLEIWCCLVPQMDVWHYGRKLQKVKFLFPCRIISGSVLLFFPGAARQKRGRNVNRPLAQRTNRNLKNSCRTITMNASSSPTVFLELLSPDTWRRLMKSSGLQLCRLAFLVT